AFIPRDLSVPIEINNLTVRWFLNVNVTNSTGNNPIANAQVIINDSFATNIFNSTTDSTGGISTQLVTEYTMNGSVPFNVDLDTCTDVRNNVNITCFTPYNFSVNITGYTSAAKSVDVNRSKFENISMSIAAGDTILPIVNTTFNKSVTAINRYDIINYTANVTDETGLSFCQVIVNQSGPNAIEIINISLSGTTGECSNKTQITLAAGGVINFTIRVNDTSNNFRTNDTIITIVDITSPVLTVTLDLGASQLGERATNNTNTSDPTPTIVWNLTESTYDSANMSYIAISVDNNGPGGNSCNLYQNLTDTVNANRNGSITVNGPSTPGCRALSNG
ncbi:MAG: hypothetical protein AAB853_05420, partial [Patescibacteria group bacterium]